MAVQPSLPADQAIPEPAAVLLVISNLPPRTRWQDLKDLFRKVSSIVWAEVIIPSVVTESVLASTHYHGVVVVPDEQNADLCISQFDGILWHGYVLAVMRGPAELCRIYDIEPSGGGDPESSLAQDATMAALQQRQSAAAANTDCCVVFVGNLPFACQWQQLKDLLRPAGRVVHVDVATVPSGRSRGWATTTFSSPEEATRAIEQFDGFMFQGRKLRLRLDKYWSGRVFRQHQQTLAVVDSVVEGRSRMPSLVPAGSSFSSEDGLSLDIPHRLPASSALFMAPGAPVFYAKAPAPPEYASPIDPLSVMPAYPYGYPTYVPFTDQSYQPFH